MSLTAEQADALTTQFAADTAKLHAIVHGDAETSVETESGNVPTIAKRLAEIGTGISGGLTATSASELAIGTGEKVFEVEAGKLFAAGQTVLAVAADDDTKWMLGSVVSYDATTLTLDISASLGAGTVSSWHVGLSGPRGPQGVPGAPGADGADGAGAWGEIGGDLSDQTDLQAALDAKQNANGNLAALAALALAANRLLHTDGTGALAQSALSAFALTLLAGADAAAMRVILGAASPGDITTAINNVVDAAPSVLDTFKEFADALGNDPNYAATMATSLAGKQPLDATLTALAGLNGSANKLPYFTGADAFALADLTAYMRGLLGTTSVGGLRAALSVRELLTGNRTYYVRSAPVTVAISIATPGIVTQNAHGRAADDPIVLSILPNTKAVTFTLGTPGTVNLAAHGYAADQPVKFLSTARLPVGLAQGTTYYVLAAGLTTDSFRVAAAPGGAAIAFTAPAVTVTIASPGVFSLTAHGLSVGDPVAFATDGALPTGLAVATLYFVKTVHDANSFTVAATPEGTAIVTSGSQSGTHTLVAFGTHYVEQTGALPTGLTAGTVYYVRNPTLNTYELATAPGGASIATSGTQSGVISAQWGNDNNDGLTAATPLLTIQKAIDRIAAIDLGGFTATIQCANGRYLGAYTLKALVGGTATIQGSDATPGNADLNATSAHVFNANSTVGWTLRGLKLSTATAGNCIVAALGASVSHLNCEFAACAGSHIYAASNANVNAAGASRISGGAVCHWQVSAGYINDAGTAITLVGRPAFSGQFANAGAGGQIPCNNGTITGIATGTRYLSASNAAIIVNGAGVNYLPGSIAGSSSTGYYG